MNYLIVEGLDKAGKSTIVSLLKEKIEERYEKKVKIICEPSRHSPRCAEINNLVKYGNLSNKEKLYLFIEARRLVFQEQIIPALEEDKLIISDRSFITNMVYQSQSGEFGLNEILDINLNELSDIKSLLIPDMALYVDLDYKTFLSRSKNCSDVTDELEHPLHNPNTFNRYRDSFNSALQFVKFYNPDFKYETYTDIEKILPILAKTFKLPHKSKDLSKYFIPA